MSFNWSIFARVCLCLAALGFLYHGLASLLNPQLIQHEAGVLIESAIARIEARAEYGGLATGLGLFFAYWTLKSAPPAHVFQILSIICISLFSARAAAVLIEGSVNSYHIQALAFELIIGLSALGCYFRFRNE